MTELTNKLRGEILTDLPVPEIPREQLAVFTPELLLTQQALTINLTRLLTPIQTNRTVLAIDIGGITIKAVEVEFNSTGEMQEREISTEEKVRLGSNYLPFLRKVACSGGHSAVGISVAGKVRDGQLEDNPNFSQFVKALAQAGGLKEIFGRNAFIVNDAVAAAIGGYWLASANQFGNKMILVINGGGIGGAYVDEKGQIWANEPGHIPLVSPALNPNNVTTVCGFQGRTDNICLERVGAIGAGVEAQGLIITGQRKTGKEIADLMYQGDVVARQLIDLSALITATAFEGLREANQAGLSNLVLVGHGGAFKISGFGERVTQILSTYFQNQGIIQPNLQLLIPGSFGISNLGAVGAALGAVVNS